MNLEKNLSLRPKKHGGFNGHFVSEAGPHHGYAERAANCEKYFGGYVDHSSL
jgi:hypothetical protein